MNRSERRTAIARARRKKRPEHTRQGAAERLALVAYRAERARVRRRRKIVRLLLAKKRAAA